MKQRAVDNWFRRFKDGDFDVDDRPHKGRLKTFEDADVIYYDLLKPNETITGERYRTLMRLSRALREKRPRYEQRHEKVILHGKGNGLSGCRAIGAPLALTHERSASCSLADFLPLAIGAFSPKWCRRPAKVWQLDARTLWARDATVASEQNPEFVFLVDCWLVAVPREDPFTPETSNSMTTLGLTLTNPLKPTWKRSNWKSYPTRRIPQILRRPIITCSGRWHMVWLISSSAHMKTSKNGLIRG